MEAAMGWMLVAAVGAGIAMWLWAPADGRARMTAGCGETVPDAGRAPVSATLVMTMVAVALRQGASIPRACDVVGGAVGGGVGAGLRAVGAALCRGMDWDAAWAVALRLAGSYGGDGAAASADDRASRDGRPGRSGGAGRSGRRSGRRRGSRVDHHRGRRWRARRRSGCRMGRPGAASPPDMGGNGERRLTDDARMLNLLRDTLEPSWRRGVSPILRLEAAVEQFDTDERSRIEMGTARLSVRLLLPTGLCVLPAFIVIGVIPCVASFMM